jgi:hypothetical protein
MLFCRALIFQAGRVSCVDANKWIRGFFLLRDYFVGVRATLPTVASKQLCEHGTSYTVTLRTILQTGARHCVEAAATRAVHPPPRPLRFPPAAPASSAVSASLRTVTRRAASLLSAPVTYRHGRCCAACASASASPPVVPPFSVVPHLVQLSVTCQERLGGFGKPISRLGGDRPLLIKVSLPRFLQSLSQRFGF